MEAYKLRWLDVMGMELEVDYYGDFKRAVFAFDEKYKEKTQSEEYADDADCNQWTSENGVIDTNSHFSIVKRSLICLWETQNTPSSSDSNVYAYWLQLEKIEINEETK